MMMSHPVQASWALGSMASAFRQWSRMQRIKIVCLAGLAALQTHAGIESMQWNGMLIT